MRRVRGPSLAAVQHCVGGWGMSVPRASVVGTTGHTEGRGVEGSPAPQWVKGLYLASWGLGMGHDLAWEGG